MMDGGSDTGSVSQPLTGRVVRLHFRCHAEIPIGSFLRVTGSALWAPGTAATDPAEATQAVEQTAVPESTGISTSNKSSSFNAISANHDVNIPAANTLYASSVEMVTSPEEYPIWRTRKPVVVVINSNRSRNKSVQHHYYRYLVVSPGGSMLVRSADYSHQIQTANMAGYFAPNSTHGDDTDDTLLVSTSNETTGSTSVLQWEDPFGKLGAQHGSSAYVVNQIQANRNIGHDVPSASASAVSLVSTVTLGAGQYTSMDYRNLPYRTIDIDVQMGRPLYEESDDSNIIVRLDRWNVPEDSSFQQYLIREAINEENRRKLRPLTSDMTDISDTMDVTDDDLVRSRHLQRSVSGHATPPAFSGNNRLFFVCFHLPVVVSQNQETGEWHATWSESILAKTKGSQILAAYDAHWVGTVTTRSPLRTEHDTNQVRAILEKMNCTPIFLDPVVMQAHYYGFCKQVLWPAFHNIDLLDMSTSGWLYNDSIEQQQQAQKDALNASNQSDWDQSRLDDWWKAFKGVNQEFADVMAKVLRAGDICWIHDYHLSLLPQNLTDWEVETFGVKVTKKVFFLHIPFPTSQIFRELECGEFILQGMLHADVVGFHAFDHARHFLNAAKRILGLNYESLVGGLIGVNFQGSTVLVSMSNVSIEPKAVDVVLNYPIVTKLEEEIRRKHAGRTIICALDIGQRLSGASLKLLAYERLLHDVSSWQPRVVMIQRLLLPGSRKADEAVTVREVRALVHRIQQKFGPDVIDYQELEGTSIPLDQRLALWKSSDILMNTPIREGLNHWPMEFIYTHKEPALPGVVIASEFSALSSILNGALRVNPYDIQATVATIDKALSMDVQEREGRRYRDIDFVSSSPSDKWVKNVLRDLRDATASQQASNRSSGASPYATPSKNNKKIPVDSTAAFLARESDQSFSHLNMKTIKKAYDACKRRVIILDFNGTIVLKEPPGKYLKREILGTSGNKPPPEVIEALALLSQDPNNLIYVVSGDSSESVLSALGHLGGVGLAVSNGARFAAPVESQRGGMYGAGQGQRRWLTFDLGVDWDAVKRVALPVLSKYTARSNGSFVKLTTFSIGWSYYSCDPEWGSLQAAHLVMELENELRAFDVRFVTLKGIVEIVPRKLNKGLVVKKVLRDRNVQDPLNPVDFVLCFGDDISDEKMFTSVFTFLAEQGDEVNSTPIPPVVNEDGTLHESMNASLEKQTEISNNQYSYVVAVGKKPSHANFFVNDAQEVANCLVLLAKGEIPQGGLPVWGSSQSSHRFA